jgi:hypothetical protein
MLCLIFSGTCVFGLAKWSLNLQKCILLVWFLVERRAKIDTTLIETAFVHNRLMSWKWIKNTRMIFSRRRKDKWKCSACYGTCRHWINYSFCLYIGRPFNVERKKCNLLFIKKIKRMKFIVGRTWCYFKMKSRGKLHNF